MMEFAQLKTSLKTQISPAYLIYGADYFLLNKAVSLVQAALPQAEVTKFDATTSAETVVSALQTTSFFATDRIVVYQLEEKSNLSAINAYLKNPVPGSVILLLYYQEKHNFNVKAATEVNCNPMPENILLPLIAKQIAPRNITTEAARYLVAATGGFYSIIDNELQKLLSFHDQVQTFELAHLQPYLEKTFDYQIYELGTALLQNDRMTAAKILEFLLAGNTNEYAIFGGVVAQFRRAYYATATNDDINTVGKFLGCSPYAVKYSRRDFNHCREAVKQCYAQILDLEYQIKSGQITAANALASLIYR